MNALVARRGLADFGVDVIAPQQHKTFDADMAEAVRVGVRLAGKK